MHQSYIVALKDIDQLHIEKISVLKQNDDKNSELLQPIKEVDYLKGIKSDSKHQTKSKDVSCTSKDDLCIVGDSVSICRKLHYTCDRLIMQSRSNNLAARSVIVGLLEALLSWRDGHLQDAESMFSCCLNIGTADSTLCLMLTHLMHKKYPFSDEIEEITEKLDNFLSLGVSDGDGAFDASAALEEGNVKDAVSKLMYTLRHGRKELHREYQIRIQRMENEHHRVLQEVNEALIIQSRGKCEMSTQTATTIQPIQSFGQQDMLKLPAMIGHTDSISAIVASPSLSSSFSSSSLPSYTSKMLPPNFYLVHIQDNQLEICEGITLATHKHHNIPARSIPNGVVYCYRSENSQYTKGIKRVPKYVTIPRVYGCEAIMIPSILDLTDDVQLIQGCHLNDSMFLELPDDICLIYMKPGGTLPPGLTIVELSEVVKLSAELDLPDDVDVVQMNTSIVIPDGVEIATGCQIIATPERLKLPSNIRLIRRKPGVPIPPFVIPISRCNSNCEDIDIAINSRILEGCAVCKKPKGICFGLGIELVHRPMGHPLPVGMTLVSKVDYPEGLVLGDDFELIQLQPRFDFPATCKPAKGWRFYPRPTGVRLSPRVHLIQIDDESESDTAFPTTMSRCPMPSIPYGTVIPASVMAAEFLNGLQQPLPAGSTIAEGIEVLSLSLFERDSNLAERLLPINGVLVSLSNGATIPDGVIRGSKSGLPRDVLLPENVVLLLLSVRFELPLGVKMEPRACLGIGTQLPPSAILNKGLQVLEWPRGLMLMPGVELVKNLDLSYQLPNGFTQIKVMPNELMLLPEGSMVVALPDVIHLQSMQQITEQIHVLSMDEVRLASPDTVVTAREDSTFQELQVPPGLAFIRRDRMSSLLPPDMQLLPISDVPHTLRQFVEKKILYSKGIGGNSSIGDTHTSVELVKLHASYQLPPFCELFPGVIVLPKPHWLQAYNGWYELIDVSILRDMPIKSRTDERNLRLINSLSVKLPSRVCLGGGVVMKLVVPDDWILIKVPDDIQMHAWGSRCSGIEAVITPSNITTPYAHFLIQRSRSGTTLPDVLSPGLARGNEWLTNVALPPGVEWVHLKPWYSLPFGVTMTSTSILEEFSDNKLHCHEVVGPSMLHVISPYDCKLSHSTDTKNSVFVMMTGKDAALPSEYKINAASDALIDKYFKDFVYFTTSADGDKDVIQCVLSSSATDAVNDGTHHRYSVSNVIKVIELPAKMPTLRQRLRSSEDTSSSLSHVQQTCSNKHLAVAIHPRIISDRAIDGKALELSNNFIQMIAAVKTPPPASQPEDTTVIAATMPKVTPFADATVLSTALEAAQEEIDSLENENNRLRGKIAVTIRDSEHKASKVARLEDSISKLNEEYRNVRETISSMKGTITGLTKVNVSKSEDVVNLKQSMESMKGRFQSQIAVLTEQLSLWQDANADFNKNKEKHEELLRLKETQSIERIRDAEDRVMVECTRVLRVVGRHYCDIAKNLIGEAQMAAKESISNVSTFVNRRNLLTLPNVTDNSYDIEAVADSARHQSDSNREGVRAAVGTGHPESVDSSHGDYYNSEKAKPGSVRGAGAGSDDDDISFLSDDGAASYFTGQTVKSNSHLQQQQQQSPFIRSQQQLYQKRTDKSSSIEYIPIASAIKSTRHVSKNSTNSHSMTKGYVYMQEIEGSPAHDIHSYVYNEQENLDKIVGIFDGYLSIIRMNLSEQQVQGVIAGNGHLEHQLMDWLVEVRERIKRFNCAERQYYMKGMELAENEIVVLCSYVRRLAKRHEAADAALTEERMKDVIVGNTNTNYELRCRIIEQSDIIDSLKEACMKQPLEYCKSVSTAIRDLVAMEKHLLLFYFIHLQKALQEEREAKVVGGLTSGEAKRKALTHHALVLRKKGLEYQRRAALIRCEIVHKTSEISDWLRGLEIVVSSVIPSYVLQQVASRLPSNVKQKQQNNDQMYHDISAISREGIAGRIVLDDQLSQLKLSMRDNSDNHSVNSEISLTASQGGRSRGGYSLLTNIFSDVDAAGGRVGRVGHMPKTRTRDFLKSFKNT